MNIGVILAGGSGTRLGGSKPKQLMVVAGKTIIEHTIEAFEQNSQIDEIAIVCRKDLIPYIDEFVSRNRYTKVKKILSGGKERYHSSLAAINAYTNDDDNLLLHDAVRPLISQRIINDCITALDKYRAVAVAVPTTDTIYQLDKEGCIQSIPPRNMLRNAQTPQCFKRGLINKAYETALKDPAFVTTDDCGVVSHYLPTEPIYVVEGDVQNFKVTYKEDLLILEKFLKPTCS